MKRRIADAMILFAIAAVFVGLLWCAADAADFALHPTKSYPFAQEWCVSLTANPEQAPAGAASPGAHEPDNIGGAY